MQIAWWAHSPTLAAAGGCPLGGQPAVRPAQQGYWHVALQALMATDPLEETVIYLWR